MRDGVQRVKVLDQAKLRRYRIAAGLTQAGLAEKAGCTELHVWYLENGRRDASAPMLSTLARVLSCRTADLMADPPGEPNGADAA